MKKVLLIDGFGIIFKSYYAFISRPLTNKNGENTSSIFGFFKSLISILKKENPDYYLIALEGEGECFRNEIYPEYKANRPPAPEDLVHQIPKIIKLLEKLNIPFLFKNGFEADDVIGTIAHKFIKENDKEAIILSPDKDLRQLVTDKIIVYNPQKSGDDYEILDAENVFKKMGVKPSQIVDYLALVGDSSDNIPGVKGIGPKTATQLLSDFNDLENIYSNIDNISSKSVKEKLMSDKNNAFLSKRLATVKRDIGLELEWDKWSSKPLTIENAEELLHMDSLKTIIDSIKDYNFSIFKKGDSGSLFDKMKGNDEVEIKNNNSNLKTLNRDYQLVISDDVLKNKINKIKDKKIFCFDIETTGFDFLNDKIISMSFAIGNDIFIIPLNISIDQQEELKIKIDENYINDKLKLLKPIFEDHGILKIGHNVKFDIKFLKTKGINVTENLFDTMIAEYCLDAAFNIFNMDDLALKYLDYKTIHYNDVVQDTKKQTLQDVKINDLVKYSGEDADITYQLYEILKGKIENNVQTKNLFYEIEMPLVSILTEMEYYGVSINPEYLKKLSEQFNKDLNVINTKLVDLAQESFNPNSPKQVSEILYNKLKLPIVKKTKTGPSTDVDVLEKLSFIHPIASALLEYRTISKLKSTYSDALPQLINPKTNKIHTTYMQTGTQTGRLSSKNPNLQNIPIKTEEGRKIRTAFIPSKNNILVSADYSQIELFLLAEFSNDNNLSEAFKTGEDIHKKTASLIFDKPIDQISKEERTIGKTINFSILYGQGPHRLSENINVTRAEAANFINVYFTKYSGISRYMHDIKEKCKKTGYAQTHWGRKRTIPEILDRNKNIMANGERMAVNTTIQGTAADLIKISMVKIAKEFKKQNIRSKLIMQVHDELIFDVFLDEKEKVFKIIKNSMENGFNFKLKLQTSIQAGNNWGEIH